MATFRRAGNSCGMHIVVFVYKANAITILFSVQLQFENLFVDWLVISVTAKISFICQRKAFLF